MDAPEIIRSFGGATKVAEVTGASRTAVCNWRRDGIPAKFWLKLIDEAKAKRIAGVTRETVAWRPERGAAPAPPDLPAVTRQLDALHAGWAAEEKRAAAALDKLHGVVG